MHRGRAVDARQGAEVHHEDVGGGLCIGTDRGDRLCTEGEKMAVAIERQLGFGHVIARLRVAEEGFGTRARPFDRPAELFRGEEAQRHLVVDRRFHAKAAADIAGDDADPRFRDADHLRQIGAVGMGALQDRVAGVAVFGGVVVADRAARLHRRGGNAVDDEAALDDAVGARESGLDSRLVADLVDKADIVRAIVPDARRAPGDGAFGRGDRGQRLVLDLDPLGGIHRLVFCFGDNKGNVIADPAHPVLDERREPRLVRGQTARSFHAARGREIAPARCFPIGAGQDGQYPGHLLCGPGVDRADAGVGVGRPQHMAEHHARQHHVVDIAAAAAQQPRILEARHRLTQREFTHRYRPLRRGRGRSD